MAIEAATYISDLVSANPPATDPIGEADDHIRLLKAVLKSTFPNIDAAVTATPTVINGIDGRATVLEGYLSALGHAPGTSLANTSNVLDRINTVRAVTATTDTIVASDLGKLVSYSNTAAVAVTLPQAGSTGFPAGWFFDYSNSNDGVVTFTTTTSTIGGSGQTFTVGRGRRGRFVSDGTDWKLSLVATRVGSRGADIASATSLALPAQIADYHVVTGTTSITGISTAPAGTRVKLRFSGACLLTHDATAFVLPGALSYTTVAGDVFEFTNDAAVGSFGVNWRCTGFAPASVPLAVQSAVTGLPGALGFTLTNNSGTPNTQADYAAAYVVLVDSNGRAVHFENVSGTVNISSGGVVDGMDGSVPANGDIYFWFISNGTLCKMIGSTSATAPTTPSGYIYKVRVGALCTSGSSLRRLKQVGRDVYCVSDGTHVLPVLGAANVGIVSWTAIALAGLVPATAVRVRVNVYGNPNGHSIFVAPNNTYTLDDSATGFMTFGFGTVSFNPMVPFEMMLESTNIYYASNNTSQGVLLYGWTDKVNCF